MELEDELTAFCRAQRALLEKWRSVCSDSHDVEFLSDFPKRTRFEMHGTAWEAVKHGSGVMFCADGLVVDVPYGIGRPDVFDPDRFFDYLKSKSQLTLLGEEGTDRRGRLAELFVEWSGGGLLERQPDERGHAVFSLGSTEER